MRPERQRTQRNIRNTRRECRGADYKCALSDGDEAIGSEEATGYHDLCVGRLTHGDR